MCVHTYMLVGTYPRDLENPWYSSWQQECKGYSFLAMVGSQVTDMCMMLQCVGSRYFALCGTDYYSLISVRL